MKRFINSLIISILFSTITLAQQEVFQPGWYMVKSGAQVKVVQGNSDDARSETVWTEINYASNEVLMAFNFSKDKYYCYDPEGRVVMVKGKTSLQKIDAAGRPGHIVEEVKIGLDLSLSKGNNVWLTGFDAATKTATILLADGKTEKIPQSSIQDLKEFLDVMDKYTEWHTVE